MELEDTKCALCLNKCSPSATRYAKWKNIKNPTPQIQTNIASRADEEFLLKDQLQKIFLLRKILEIPQNQCCNFLQVYGDPSLWIDCCDLCSVLVGMAKTIFDQIMMLQRKFKKLQNQIKNKIVLTAKFENRVSDENGDWGVRDTIRSFINLGISNVKTTITKSETIEDSATLNMNETEVSGFSVVNLNSNIVQIEKIEEDYSSLYPQTDLLKCEYQEQDPLLDKRAINGNTKVTYFLGTSFNSDDVIIQTIDKDDSDSHMCNHFDVPYEGYICDSGEQDPLKLGETDGVNNSEDEVNIKEEPSSYDEQLVSQEEFGSHSKTSFDMNFSTNSCDTDKSCEGVDGESNSSTLTNYSIIDTEGRPFKCDFCGRGYLYPGQLKDHITTHTGEKAYACSVCGKSFARLDALKQHEKIHNMKTYRCKVCQKELKTSKSLIRHQKIHTGEKPYTCNFCGKKFTEAYNLNQHERIHTEDKIYKCRYCGKGFISLKSLSSHEKTHTKRPSFQCNICGKGFIRSNGLKLHERIHSGEKPYVCKFCEKRFIGISNLKIHERIHTGEKPYGCGFCEKRFTTNCHLKDHERVHHHRKDTNS